MLGRSRLFLCGLFLGYIKARECDAFEGPKFLIKEGVGIGLCNER